ncbi:hypothetical protein ABKV19_005517 [Rosa sericea]
MARYLYQKYMREKILRYRGGKDHHDSSNKSPNWQRGNRRLTEETVSPQSIWMEIILVWAFSWFSCSS